MTKNADGTVAWKEGNSAAEAFANAQEAQEALSSALAKALGSAKNFKTQATLEELMLQCDRRSGELESLVLQMTEIIVGAGSRWKCTLDYTLKGDEFNRLAKLDFSKFDDSEGNAFFEEKEDMPDGTRQFHANKLEGTVDKFAQEFKVKAEECMMDFTMNLKPTVEEEIAAQRDEGPIVA